ncbi:MAG: beta-ketoacyl-[acyl-carrier-protein] synthase family protein [Candidatus Omnitrophota bacterium]|nr:beta-ketoacyl-[acyl-carrier-protein] synthase family protein [Candidatus Omnitrophota bacterium]
MSTEYNHNAVITGIGVVSPNAIGRENFWQALEAGRDAAGEITSFDTSKFPVHTAAEVRGLGAEAILGEKGLRNLDRSALLLLTAAQLAISEAKLEINADNAAQIGVSTGTTFAHLWSIVEFNQEVFKEGLDFASPGLFPSTVINAASSHVSIRFNIQGFNSTTSTGYTSGLTALKYALGALETKKAEIVLAGAVDALTNILFFGFQKLGYMAGLKGEPVSCPFDKRRNGPLLGEGAAMFCLESEASAKKRKAEIFCRVKSVINYFDACKMGKIHPQGMGLETAIKEALEQARVGPADIDYISSCANSSRDLDKIEVKVLKKVFGKNLDKIPVSSIKSMIGETISASGLLQAASCIGAMQRGVIPPTINYKTRDPDCDIDCVPNKAQKKEVKLALVTSSGPGGYNAACILERCD